MDSFGNSESNLVVLFCAKAVKSQFVQELIVPGKHVKLFANLAYQMLAFCLELTYFK
jgi:hypothetical protein